MSQYSNYKTQEGSIPSQFAKYNCVRLQNVFISNSKTYLSQIAKLICLEFQNIIGQIVKCIYEWGFQATFQLHYSFIFDLEATFKLHFSYISYTLKLELHFNSISTTISRQASSSHNQISLCICF